MPPPAVAHSYLAAALGHGGSNPAVAGTVLLFVLWGVVVWLRARKR